MAVSCRKESPWSEVVLRHRLFLIKQVEPDFGLLDELYANEVLSDEEKAEINTENTIYKRNARLLERFQAREQYDGFIEALKSSNQKHVSTYLEKNGIYAFDDDWPLLDRERSILRINQKTLIEILDLQDLVILLYSDGVINLMQRDFISSKQTSCEKNRALLDILSRRSIRDYKKTIRCLHESKQSHIAQILVEGGVVVRVHVEIPDDRTEDEIISQFGNVLKTRSTEECRRILQALNVIAMKKGESINVYVYCKTNDEMWNLRELETSGTLVTVLQKLFIDVLFFVKCTEFTAEYPKNVEELSLTEIHQCSAIEKMTAAIDYQQYNNTDIIFPVTSRSKEKRMTGDQLEHFALKPTRRQIQAYGRKDQVKKEERHPATTDTDMGHLPWEVMDIVIQKSFLSSRLEENEMSTFSDEEVINRLASVEFCWFKRISKRRFKNITWRQLSAFYSSNNKTAVIIRNNRQFLESCIRPKGFIKQLKSIDCLTDVQTMSIKRQKFKEDKTRQHKLCISDLLNIIRSCDKSRQLSFTRCLPQNGQRDAARVEMNGGVVVKADLKYPDASHNKVVIQQMVEKFNELAQKIRNKIRCDDEENDDVNYEEIEIFESLSDREAVVWIWCKSQEAFENVQHDYESNLLAEVFTIVTKHPPLFTDSNPNISIDLDQLKKEIAQNPLMFEIERNTEFLIESMDPNPDLLIRLRAFGSLTREEIDEIVQQPTYYMMNNEILKCILTKSRSTELIKALKETGQADLTYHEEERVNIIRVKRVHIFKNLTRVEDIASYMHQDKKLTDMEVDRINSVEWTSVRAIEELLNIIVEKPRDVYECFLDALKKTNQNHLYQILTTKHEFENIWMEDIKLAIANNNQFLMENMRSNPLIDLLRSEQLMTYKERELIKNQPNESCTIIEILHWINSKFQNTSNWQTLIKCLRRSDQNVLADVLEKGGVTVRSKFSSKLYISTSLISNSKSELRLQLRENEELVVDKLNQSRDSPIFYAKIIEIFGYGIEIVPCCHREEDGIVVWFLCHSQAALKRLEELYKSKDLLIEKLKSFFQLLLKDSHLSTSDSVLVLESLTISTDDFNKQIERRHNIGLRRGIANGIITGMAILGDEIFICTERSLEIKVYHKRSLVMIRKFVVKGLENLEDIVSSSCNKRLYIADEIYIEELCMILAVDPQGNILKPFRVENGSCCLSVTMESNVVALLLNEKKLIELTAELAVIREIKLLIQDPWYSCALPNGNFVTIYDRYNLGVIDSAGNVVKSASNFFKEYRLFPRCLRVDKAGLKCIVCCEDCAIFLTSELECPKTLKFPHTGIWTIPKRICLEESMGLLYLAGEVPYGSFICVCDVTDLKD